MKDINVINLTGKVANPEIKGEEGNEYLVFSLANHYDVPNGEGFEERTQFIPCKVFPNGWAKSLAKNLEKGIEVSVQGKIIIQQFTDNEGNIRTITYVKVTNLKYYSKKKETQVSNEINDEDVPL